MRILLITTSYPRWKGDYAGAFLHRLGKSIIKLGHELTVMVPHSRNTSLEENIDGVEIHRYKYLPEVLEATYGSWYAHEQTKNKFRKIFLQAKNIFRLSALLLSGYSSSLKFASSHDVIFSNWAFPSGYIGVKLSQKSNLPHIMKVYGGDITIASKNPVLRHIIINTLKSADDVTSNSNYTAIQTQKIVNQRVTPTYEGVETDVFHPSVDPIFIQDKYPGDPILFSLGRFVPYKGFKYAIEAAAMLKKEYPNLIWIVGGTGPLWNSNYEMIKKLKLEDTVKLVGFIPEKLLPHFYAACNVYIAPSIVDEEGNTEGLNVSVLEAASTGKATIASRVGGLVEAINDGETGLLVQEKSSRKLKESIQLLLDDKKLADSMGRRGRIWILDNFEIIKITKQLIELFDSRARVYSKKKSLLSRS